MTFSNEPFFKKFSSNLPTFPEMEEIDKVIKKSLCSNVSIFRDTTKYLYDLGGKRIRPYLCLLVAHTFSNNLNKKILINTASAIELLHTSSLYHDDIIDDANLRRNQDTANKKFGLANSLLAGNYLYIRAFSLMQNLNKKYASFIEESCIKLTEGEALESNLSMEEFTIESAIEIARLKTGSLFMLASYLGTSIATTNQDVAKDMALYGENIGIVFQIMDDILDISSNNCEKNIGQDLIGGKPSIINTLWLKSGSELAKSIFSLNKDDKSDELISIALQEIQDSSFIEQATKIAKKYQKKALQYLQYAKDKSEYLNDDFFQYLEEVTKQSII